MVRSGSKLGSASHSRRVRSTPAGSTGRRNTGVKSLRWGFKLQGLTKRLSNYSLPRCRCGSRQDEPDLASAKSRTSVSYSGPLVGSDEPAAQTEPLAQTAYLFGQNT